MGKLFAVGLGPGGADEMTPRARAAMDAADVICGYTTYIKLVKPLYPDKEYLSTGMRSEVERCKLAIEAAAGKDVAMVCSGDAGTYGMAGLLYELLGDESPIEIEVIPGMTAATSGAARLGAPLMQDFAVVSLSDLLVSWDMVEQRLRGAAVGDFVTVLYNPGSHRRTGHLKRACEIMLEQRDESTPCGIVENIGREGEDAKLLTLGELRDTAVDMFATVFIGNSRTRLIGGKMVTLRGYEEKE